MISAAVSPLMGMGRFVRRMQHTIKYPYARMPHYSSFPHKPFNPVAAKKPIYTLVSWWRSLWNWMRNKQPVYRIKQTPKRLYKPAIGLASATLAATTYVHYQPQQNATLWESRAQGHAVERRDMIKSFINDCVCYAGDNNAIPVHQKNNQSVRIATYNVHEWLDPYGAKNFDGIVTAIKQVQADVMILQEVALFNKATINDALHDAGYHYTAFVTTINSAKRPCGNMIISKYPFTQKPVVKTFNADYHAGRERRGFIKTDIALPNNNTITLYGTHLDVWDASECKRTHEAAELVSTSAHVSGNVLIGADFNAVRPQDYQYQVKGKKVWDLLNANHMQRTGIPVPTTALAQLEQADYIDSFTRAGAPNPRFTVWSGTAVDFLYLNKQWQLPVLGSYVYYSAASDHLPVIMDVACPVIQKA